MVVEVVVVKVVVYNIVVVVIVVVVVVVVIKVAVRWWGQPPASRGRTKWRRLCRRRRCTYQ